MNATTKSHLILIAARSSMAGGAYAQVTLSTQYAKCRREQGPGQSECCQMIRQYPGGQVPRHPD